MHLVLVFVSMFFIIRIIFLSTFLAFLGGATVYTYLRTGMDGWDGVLHFVYLVCACCILGISGSDRARAEQSSLLL
jgi:hypothetical protein